MNWLRFPRGVWLYAWALALLTSLPYVAGFLATPAGGQYSGAPALPIGTQVDFNSHMAKMQQGARGQWDYQLLFTQEAHVGIFPVQGFYVALGALTRLIPVSLPLMYHAARLMLTTLMAVAIWAFASRYFEAASGRWTALLFATAVGGWSWLLLFLAPGLTAIASPIEFWLTDAFNLLGAAYMPHFTAAIILQIVSLLSFEDWVRQGRWVDLVKLTLALTALSIIQPYVVVLMGSLLGLLALRHVFISRQLTWQRALWLVVPLGLHGGVTLYQYVRISADPIWAAFTAQNQTLSPPVLYYVFGYLSLLLPAGFGLVRQFVDGRSRLRPYNETHGEGQKPLDDRRWMVMLWVVLVALLLYAPLPTQRRYLLGVQTPLAMLAAYGWVQVFMPRLRPARRTLMTIAYVALGSTALLVMLLGHVNALRRAEANPAFYLPEEVRAYDWLRSQGQPDALVLTTFDMDGEGSGGWLVAATGQRVFLGHWFETAFVAQKMADLRQFYDEATDNEWRQDFLSRVGVAYIWYDDSARATGGWNPAAMPELSPVFTDGSLTIYRVVGL
jgi:hypothetical protein